MNRRVTVSTRGTIRKPVANAEEKTGIHSVFAKKPFEAWSVKDKTKFPKNPPSARRITQRAHSVLRAATSRFIRSRKPRPVYASGAANRSEEHTSELQSLRHLVCRLLLEK